MTPMEGEPLHYTVLYSHAGHHFVYNDWQPLTTAFPKDEPGHYEYAESFEQQEAQNSED